MSRRSEFSEKIQKAGNLTKILLRPDYSLEYFYDPCYIKYPITDDQIVVFFMKKMASHKDCLQSNTYNKFSRYHVKINMLSAYAYNWYLGMRKRKLFYRKEIEINCTGYHIGNKIMTPKEYSLITSKPLELEDVVENFLNNIWDCYGELSFTSLSEMQKREIEKISKCRQNYISCIHDDLIKNFYTYDNEEIRDYLPKNVVLTEGYDGTIKLSKKTQLGAE